MTYYLGMDGGGTKTAFVLIDSRGETIAAVEQPSSYYFDQGIGLLERIVKAGVTEVVASAGIGTGDIGFAFFGMPGYGESSGDIARLDAIPGEVLGHDRYLCGNDMLGGWAGSLGGADGINVIAGTGSMTYGERHGHGHRVGGWSEVFGDEGSAHWIGIRGLNAFTRMADGRLARGPLYELMRERVGITADLDLIGVVVDEWGAKRTAIGNLSKVVVAAGEAGDPHAARILRDASTELVDLVATTRRALEYPADETVVVSYSGGMFRVPVFRDGFASALDAATGDYELRSPRHGPGTGSALYAMKHAGAPLPAASIVH